MNINNFAFIGGTCDMEMEIDGIELTAEAERR